MDLQEKILERIYRDGFTSDDLKFVRALFYEYIDDRHLTYGTVSDLLDELQQDEIAYNEMQNNGLTE